MKHKALILTIFLFLSTSLNALIFLDDEDGLSPKAKILLELLETNYHDNEIALMMLRVEIIELESQVNRYVNMNLKRISELYEQLSIVKSESIKEEITDEIKQCQDSLFIYITYFRKYEEIKHTYLNNS